MKKIHSSINQRLELDKRGDFNFSIGNFQFICSNIPADSRVCDSYHDFLDRGLLLARKLVFLMVKLEVITPQVLVTTMTLLTVGRISMSQMTTNILNLAPRAVPELNVGGIYFSPPPPTKNNCERPPSPIKKMCNLKTTTHKIQFQKLQFLNRIFGL